jgi:hypothetical protein
LQAIGTRRDAQEQNNFEVATNTREVEETVGRENALLGGRGRGGRPVLSRKPFGTQFFPSSGSMSAVSHTHMVFDFEYLFRLSYCYIFRFIDSNRIVDMESVTNLASLIHLTPKIRVLILKVDGADAHNTAEYVTSYKLLMGALHSVSHTVTKTKIPGKFTRLSETQRLAVEALNLALARRGEGMSKAVVPPRGSRIDAHVILSVSC